jgi:hypothetical protein
MIAWPASRARLPPATLSIGALPADRESRRRPYRGQNGNSSTVDLVVRVMKEVIALASAVLLAACTSSGPDRSLPPVESTPVPTPTTGASTHGREDASVLVRAPGSFLETCRETARMVGYPVPCPSKILAGGTPPPEGSTCRIDLIGAGGLGGCAHAWRGWVVGSMQTNQHHLVLQASPEPIRSLSRMINGPGWYPGASEVRLGTLHVGGWTMHAVYADPATNVGSVFSDHLVLVWTTGGHTYALGFHLDGSRRETQVLNQTVARSVSLVAP